MNKEEAIKQLGIILQNIIKERKQGIASIEGIKFQEALQTVLNLIEKQSKEIEELDSENEVLEEIKISYEKKTDKLLKEIKDIYKMLTTEKEKNINLINTNKKLYEMGQQNAIQELINKDYVSEDKIKAKIEEIDIEIQCCEYADDDTEEYKQDIEKEKRRLLRDKAVLQSLLEKE